MVIITDAQYRSTVSMLQELFKYGEDIVICAEEGSDPPAFYSKYCTMSRFMPKDRDEYKTELLNLCRLMSHAGGEDKPVLIPVGMKTVSMLSEYRDEFSAVADFIVPEKAVLDALNDKRRAAAAAKNIGIRVPREIGMTSDGKPVGAVCYPVIVKPVFGESLGLSAGKRYAFAYSEEELCAEYRRFSYLAGERPIVQEYAGSEGAGVCVVMDGSQRPVSVFCHRRLREYPVSGGPSSCCVSFYNENLVKKTVELLASAGFSGIAMAEFRRGGDGNYSFLEINPRIWGSYPLSVKAKSRFIENYVLASRGAVFEKPDANYERGKMMRFFVNDLLSCAGYIRSGSALKGAWGVASLFDLSVSDGVFDPSDPSPFKVYLKNCRKKAAAMIQPDEEDVSDPYDEGSAESKAARCEKE